MRIGVTTLALAVAAALVTPFVITGIFRLVPSVKTFVVFSIVLGLSCFSFILRPSLRPLAAGVFLGAGGHALFLYYLFGFGGPE